MVVSELPPSTAAPIALDLGVVYPKRAQCAGPDLPPSPRNGELRSHCRHSRPYFCAPDPSDERPRPGPL